MILYEEASNLYSVTIREKNSIKPSNWLKQMKDIHNKIKGLVKAMNNCSSENEYATLLFLFQHCYIIGKLKKRRQVLKVCIISQKEKEA